MIRRTLFHAKKITVGDHTIFGSFLIILAFMKELNQISQNCRASLQDRYSRGSFPNQFQAGSIFRKLQPGRLDHQPACHGLDDVSLFQASLQCVLHRLIAALADLNDTITGQLYFPKHFLSSTSSLFWKEGASKGNMHYLLLFFLLPACPSE